MYKNRKISLLVAFSLIVSTFTSCMQVFAEQLYTDVDENHWAYASVKYMKDNNYISVDPETLRHPLSPHFFLRLPRFYAIV